MANTPAGWFPQEDGRQRYWDGEKWTEHFAPGDQHRGASPEAAAADVPPAQSPDRPWFKKKRFIIPAGVVGLVMVASALGGGGDDPTTPAAAPVTSASESATPAASSPAVAESTAPAPAASRPSAAPAQDKTLKYGSKVRDGKFEFVVSGMKCGIDSVGNEFLSTEPQGEYCKVTMKITNIGDEAQSMFADNQLAFDGENRKFSADTEASIYDDKSQVLFEEINPGNTVDGSVYFDVPKGTKLVKMELHDSLFSGGVEVVLKK